MDLQLYRGATK